MISGVPHNEWCHLAFTRDGSGNIKSYLNGVASGTSSTTDEFALDFIGEQVVCSMCNVAMWTRELSPEEVQSVMNKSYSQLGSVEKTSLVMWQSLDSTGYGSDLTLGKGSFEDGNGWSAFGSPADVGYSTTNVYLGSQSLHVENCANNKGAQLVGQFAIVSGEQIYVDAWVYVVDGTKVQMGINGTTDSLFLDFNVTANTWTNITHTFTANSSTTTYVLFSATDGFDEFYVDNCTAKKVGFNDSTSNNNFGANNGATTTTSVYGGNAPVLPRAIDIAESFADAIGNGSASFDGSSYIDTGTGIGNLLGDNYGDSFTLSMWFKADVTSGNDGLFDIGNFGTAVGDLFVLLYSNELSFYLDYAGGGWHRKIAFTDTSNWNHLACVYKAGSESDSKMYLNGISVGSTGGTFPNSTALDFNGFKTIIGAYLNSSSSFDGQISQVGFWLGALTQAQIQSVMESTSYAKIPASVKSTLGTDFFTDSTFDLSGTQSASTTGTYWTTGSAWTISNGEAIYDATAHENRLELPSATLQSAGLYKFSFTVSDANTKGAFKIKADGNDIIATNYYDNGDHVIYYNQSGAYGSAKTIKIEARNDVHGAFKLQSASWKLVTNDLVAYYSLDADGSRSLPEFNGSNNYVNLGRINLYQGAFSCSYWVYHDTNDGTKGHFILPYDESSWASPYVRWIIRTEATAKLNTYIGSWGTGANVASYMTTGEWNHIVFTHDGTTSSGTNLWINGTKRITGVSSSQATLTDDGSNLYMGTSYGIYNNSSEMFDGFIHNVAFMTSAVISDANIASIYALGKDGDFRTVLTPNHYYNHNISAWASGSGAIPDIVGDKNGTLSGTAQSLRSYVATDSTDNNNDGDLK
jgi:hypothetical protein